MSNPRIKHDYENVSSSWRRKIPVQAHSMRSKSPQNALTGPVQALPEGFRDLETLPAKPRKPETP